MASPEQVYIATQAEGEALYPHIAYMIFHHTQAEKDHIRVSESGAKVVLLGGMVKNVITWNYIGP